MTHQRIVEKASQVDVAGLGHYCALCPNCFHSVVIINQDGGMTDETLVLEVCQEFFVLAMRLLRSCLSTASASHLSVLRDVQKLSARFYVLHACTLLCRSLHDQPEPIKFSKCFH